MEETFAVWSGRFQPPHIGHFAILRRSLDVLDMRHAAVLVAHFGWAASGAYGMYANQAYSGSKNPLTVWERITLMELGIDGCGFSGKVIVLAAPRHDLDWERVKELYPARRIICLTAKDDFEQAKVELWRERGEEVRVLSDLTSGQVLTTTSIRKLVADGADWREFLVESCHEYFTDIDGPRRVFGL